MVGVDGRCNGFSACLSALALWGAFLCLKSLEKFGSLCTMTMRAVTHHFKPAPFLPAKSSNWWVIRRTALTWHPMTSYSCTSRKNAWSTIFVARRCCSKTMFWRCLNRGGKSALTVGLSACKSV